MSSLGFTTMARRARRKPRRISVKNFVELNGAEDYGGDSQTKMNTEVAILTSDTLLYTVAKEMNLEHWFRDLRTMRIVEGASEIHRYLIAREMFGAAATGRSVR